ncbi:MAG: hypothetical protein K0S00_4440 [Xanthobacteraceae bacterium]|jgi:hypothetical protein|nr:hypothetical protein [Xanthobacteraceae bacterium]
MPDRKEAEMSKYEFAVAYDGTGRPEPHSIDVQTLAPALLAFGRLLREANHEINGKKSIAKVLVVSDFEHKCFHINFELVVGIYEQIKALLATDEAKSAKDILEWVGLIVGPSGLFGMSFFQYLKWKKGRKVEVVPPLVDSDKRGKIEVRIVGDGNTVQIDPSIYRLSENPTALRAARDAFIPIGTDGFDEVKFKDGGQIAAEFGAEAVRDIVESCNSGIAESKDKDPEIETVTAWLSVYSPVYDEDAGKWRFRYGRDVIYADITETDIAKSAIERGGAMVDDAYQVVLEISSQINSEGKVHQANYKILSVIKFVPAPPKLQQSDLFD